MAGEVVLVVPRVVLVVATRWPAFSIAMAMCRPIPEPAPVITTPALSPASSGAAHHALTVTGTASL